MRKRPGTRRRGMPRSMYILIRKFPKSEKSTGGYWEVLSHRNSGKLSCNCPIWIYKHQMMNGERWCKHLEQTVADMAEIPDEIFPKMDFVFSPSSAILHIER